MQQNMKKHLVFSQVGGVSLATALMLSFVAHGVFLLVPWKDIFSDGESIEELQRVEIELGTLQSVTDHSGIKDAQKSDQVRLPAQLLPQLTSRLRSADKSEIEETEVPEEKEDKKDHTEDAASDTLELEKSVVQEDEKEQVVQEGPLASRSKQKDRRAALEEKTRQAFVAMQKEEAMRRMLLEEARKKKQFADKIEAEEVVETQVKASVKAEGGSVVSAAVYDEYTRQIQLAIARFYDLPEVYRYAGEDLKTLVVVTLDTKGYVLTSQVEESSGDSLFDRVSLDVISRASPFGEPPQAWVGREMVIHFAPR
ncbi:MAG: TonB family protein [Proteobacteria bacterium]|nr:TonB family protein [Pseudomonadota bacterium]